MRQENGLRVSVETAAERSNPLHVDDVTSGNKPNRHSPVERVCASGIA